MRTLTALVLVLCGCATPRLGRFEGASSDPRQGSGGATLTVDGVEFWSAGGPSRLYRPLGVVVSGSRDARMVAALVRQVGGHAVLRLKDDSEVLAMINGRHVDSTRDGIRLVVVTYEGAPPLREVRPEPMQVAPSEPEPEVGGG